MNRPGGNWCTATIAIAACAVAAGCSETSHTAVDLTITNVTLYAGPGREPIDAATIVIDDGIVVEIGSEQPNNSRRVIDAGGRIATAGLWNSHVHFTNPAVHADTATAVQDMLLRFGFTTVVDTGSDLAATLTLAAAFDTGEVAGPRILTASGSFVHTNGTPAYLPGVRLPEIENVDAAEPMVAAVLAAGADGIKIFSGSFQSPTQTIHLPPAIIAAITRAAHAKDSFVMSHPQSRQGLIAAVQNGVDVLAHTAPSAGPLGQELIAEMVRRNVALIPTLKLWRYELTRAGVPEQQVRAFLSQGVGQLAEFAAADGEIIFGTDVGFMSDADPTEEYALMGDAGLDFSAILTSLTTNPAGRFLGESGEVAVGARADIVIYRESPAKNPTNFAQVAYTISRGRVVYEGALAP